MYNPSSTIIIIITSTIMTILVADIVICTFSAPMAFIIYWSCFLFLNGTKALFSEVAIDEICPLVELWD